MEGLTLLSTLGIEAGVYIANGLFFLLAPAKGRTFRTYMALLCIAVALTIIFDMYTSAVWIDGNHDVKLENLDFMLYMLSVPFDICIGYSILTPYRKNSWMIRFILLSDLYIIITTTAYILTGDEFIYISAWVYEVLYVIINMVILAKLYIKYEKTIKNNYSDISGRSAGWIKLLMYLFIVIIAIDITCAIYNLDKLNIIEACTNIVIITTACYFVNKQKPVDELLAAELSSDSQEPDTIHVTETEGISSQESHNISATDAISLTNQCSTIAQKLKETFEDGKMYLKPDLNSREVAHSIGTNERYLSYFLNNVMGKNFHAYVCELRLNYARHLMTSNTGLQITDIAYQSGFNSPNTFSIVFKKQFNMTPYDYLKEWEKHSAKPTPTVKSEDRAETMIYSPDTVTNKDSDSNDIDLSGLGLNDRETRLCHLILRGLANQDIATEMNISRESLRVTKSRLLKKIDPDRQYHDLKQALDARTSTNIM